MEKRSIRFTALSLALTAGCFGRQSTPPERLFAVAEDLQLRYEQDASRQAVSKYREALTAWTQRGDAQNAARAGQRLGAIHEQLGLPRESLRATTI